jgi:hypothetical protein
VREILSNIEIENKNEDQQIVEIETLLGDVLN